MREQEMPIVLNNDFARCDESDWSYLAQLLRIASDAVLLCGSIFLDVRHAHYPRRKETIAPS